MKLVLSFTLVLFSAASGFGENGADEVNFKLPKTNDVPILVMDYVGGFRQQPARGFVRKPQLQVFPDGRVVRSQNTPQIPGAELKLTDKQLKAFLKEVIIDSKVYEISEADIKEQMADGGARAMIADAPTLKLSVNLGDVEHTVSVYALSFVARRHPKITPLANLARIEKACKRLMSIADLGSFEKLNEVLAIANKQLKKEGHGSMATTDLYYVLKRASGATSIYFRKVMGKDNNRSNIQVKITADADGKMTTKVTASPYRGS